MPKKTAIIIGAGIGGLSTAIRLAKKNYQVTVFEKATHAGGKVKRIENNGFTWGYGASLLTMPHLIDELFEICGKNPRDYFNYLPLHTICKYFYKDGTILNAFNEEEKLIQELETQLNENNYNVKKYLSNIRNIFKHTEHIFLQSSLHKLKTYLNYRTLKAIFNLADIGLFETMNNKNSNLFSNPKTIQLFNRYATYNGSNPFRTPATMNVIAAPEYTQGGFIMENGMPQISELLFSLAEEVGVQFVLNTSVSEIICEANKATGVKVGNEIIKADAIISNVDIHFTYNNLLPKAKKPIKILSQERSTSALIFYWGISKSFHQLETHNIFFSDNYKNEFNAIDKAEIYSDATVYLFISSKKIDSHAPKDCENWFALINVPHHQGQNWKEETEKCKKIIIDKLSAVLNEDISKYIVCEKVTTPESIELDTSSFAGSLYGPSSNNKMSAFLRHPNFSKDIKNVYFTGGSVHPGGGVPLCILSGKIVASLID